MRFASSFKLTLRINDKGTGQGLSGLLLIEDTYRLHAFSSNTELTKRPMTLARLHSFMLVPGVAWRC